jgi:ELWxxDGT repeat protein
MYFNAAVGSRHAYFSHNDTTHGIELWRTDGTAAGTTLVADLEPNGGSEPMPLAVLNGKLLFQATTAATGAELYAVDLDAHSYPAGRGCGGASIPALSATDPVLGQTMEFRARSAPSSRAGLLAIGLFGTTEQLLDNCAVILDLSLPLITFGFATDSSGLAKLVVPLPNDPGLANLALPMQAVFGPTTTGPLSMDFSNGLVLHPGVQ